MPSSTDYPYVDKTASASSGPYLSTEATRDELNPAFASGAITAAPTSVGDLNDDDDDWDDNDPEVTGESEATGEPVAPEVLVGQPIEPPVEPAAPVGEAPDADS